MKSLPKRRILMVGPVPPPYGGIASVIDDIVCSELSADYSFHVFPRTAGFPPGYRGFLGRNIFRFRRFMRFFKEVNAGSYELVHIHSADPSFPGTLIFMILAQLARTKVVLHMHGTDWDDFYERASPITQLSIRWGLLLPDRVAVLYTLWADRIRQLVPKADVCVVGNLVRRQEPPDASVIRAMRERLGLEREHFVVLTVGSVGWRKGSFEILKAVPQIVSEDDVVRFVLVGGEEASGQAASLRSVVERQGLGKWVIFTGETERENIPVFMGLADMFLLPSFIEGMPISIIEAMQWGVPVIATRVAAIPDMIEDGVSGLLIHPGKPDEIASAVLRVRRDSTLRQQLSRSGKKVFGDRFEFSRGIERIRRLYEVR
jgi:glycosyltransferase involved in cell wall biosynthesis